MTGFKDHFSGHAVLYREYRPSYPAELFDWLAEIAPARGLAWDAGCGNGQAAVALAERFARVIASDPSREQIASALAHPRIEYRIARAEESGMPAAAADLATVAQALHWFDIEAYWTEVRRVVRPAGIVAVWSYALLALGADIDALIEQFYSQTVGRYWPPERRLTETGYRTIGFPFDEFESPSFAMRADWTLAQLTGYLRTWSAVQRYRQDRGDDPVDALEEELAALWGDAQQPRTVRWPLALRVGRVMDG